MRRQVSFIIPALCTMLLLGAGACMPQLTAAVQDYQLEREVAQREDTNVSLVLSQSPDFFRRLELFDLRQSQINLAEGDRMTADDVRKTAKETMDRLEESGVWGDGGASEEPGYSLPEVTPILIANKDDPRLSGVFWRCGWEGGSEDEKVLWLDDKSGKMIAFQGRIRIDATIYLYETGPYYDVLSALASFCREYYSIDNVVMSTETENSDFGAYTLLLTKGGGEGDAVYPISVRLRDNLLNFNL